MCLLMMLVAADTVILARISSRLTSQCGNGECAGIALDDSNNDTKDTEGRSKNLHNQNLDKQRWVLCIRNSTTGSSNSNRNPRGNICQTNRKTSREHSVSSVVISGVIPAFFQVKVRAFWFLNFVGKDNGHNDTVDSSGFAENDTARHTKKIMEERRSV